MASWIAAGGLRRLVERFRGSAADESGLTAVEYGLLAAFMGTVFVLAGPALWQGLLGVLDGVLGRMLS